MLESGFRISDLQNIPVYKDDCGFKNKIALDNTFILSYSHTVYGINYNKQNYKIPLNFLRDDLKGYIGIESITAPWSGQLKFWHGSWDSTDKNRAYSYVWKNEDKNHINYNPNKFSDLDNSYYIIKDAPFPFETEDLNNRGERGEVTSEELQEGDAYCNNSINTPIQKLDPHPDSNKIVTKSYIDERLSGKRLVEVTTDFYVRDYDCTYIIRAEELQKSEFNKIIQVHFPENYNKRSLHNKLEFTILVEGKWDNASGVWLPAIEDFIEWQVFDFDGKEIEPIWLNIKRPEINDEYLYSNARYLVFRFETITGKKLNTNENVSAITATPIIEETEAGNIVIDYDAVANYDVTILCENSLYRNTGIETVNGNEGNYLNIVSKGNTIIPSTTLVGSEITVNLETDLRSSTNSVIITEPSETKKYWDLNVPTVKSTDGTINITGPTDNNKFWDLSVKIPDLTDIQSTDKTVTITRPDENNAFWDLSVDIPEPVSIPKPRIKKLPAEINLLEANGNVYWSDSPNPSINFGNIDSINDEVITFKLLYYVTEDSTSVDSEHIIWAMSDVNQQPIFIKDRIYMITFTTFSSSPFRNFTSIGKIDYFLPASKIEWSPEN